MIVKTREMGMTHRDFFRTFPAVAHGTPWRQDGDKVVLGDPEKQVAIFIGPEFGTVARPDLVAAAREAVRVAGEPGFGQ